MVIDTHEISTLDALKAIVLALERRFPHHNGPFEYCTRLAEEVGELVEALAEIKASPSKEAHYHLAKEAQDVLRVALGIVCLYGLDQDFPAELVDIAADVSPTPAKLAIVAGELASAVNHTEGMGVKREKHGDEPDTRVLACARNLMTLVVAIIHHYDIETEFKRQLAEHYIWHRDHGFIEKMA